jgi:DNA repair exonuclease SbcCD ATPase subunit
MARSEREGLSRVQREFEGKAKELEIHRVKLDKEHIEAIERFKSELQRSMQDQDFDLHRRKLQLEEDEQRVRLERDRIAQISNANSTMSKELTQVKQE